MDWITRCQPAVLPSQAISATARCSKDLRQMLRRLAKPRYCSCSRKWRRGGFVGGDFARVFSTWSAVEGQILGGRVFQEHLPQQHDRSTAPGARGHQWRVDAPALVHLAQQPQALEAHLELRVDGAQSPPGPFPRPKRPKSSSCCAGLPAVDLATTRNRKRDL